MRADLAVLKDRSFLLLYLARTASFFGTAIAPVALAFAILDMPGGSGERLGWVMGSRAIALVTCFVLGGVVADRLPRYGVVVSSDLVAAAAQAGIAVMFITGYTALGPLLVLSALGGMAAAVFFPAVAGLT